MVARWRCTVFTWELFSVVTIPGPSSSILIYPRVYHTGIPARLRGTRILEIWGGIIITATDPYILLDCPRANKVSSMIILGTRRGCIWKKTSGEQNPRLRSKEESGRYMLHLSTVAQASVCRYTVNLPEKCQPRLQPASAIRPIQGTNA